MPRTKKIKDKPDLVKDTTSQAVINTNSNAILARRAQIAQEKAKEELDWYPLINLDKGIESTIDYFKNL